MSLAYGRKGFHLSAKMAVKRLLPKGIINALYRIWRPVEVRLFPTYNEDGIITDHNCDFIRDRRFAGAYDLVIREGLTIGGARWRAHVSCWVGNWCKSLDGDFVECGVNKGYQSRLVMEYTGFRSLSKKFYLLDTFEGLVEEYASEKEKADGKLESKYGAVYEQVLKTFRGIENVVIIKGPVPDTLSQVKSNRIAYLALDMNCVIPEIEAIKYFWDKLVPGAMVLLDDYGFPGYEELKAAYDEFASSKGVEVLCLPTGQGLFIRPW